MSIAMDYIFNVVIKNFKVTLKIYVVEVVEL